MGIGAFGNVISQRGVGTSPYGFTGESGAPTGLEYLRARYYDPTQGLQGGNILVLDMGEQIRIVDLARDLKRQKNDLNVDLLILGWRTHIDQVKRATGLGQRRQRVRCNDRRIHAMASLFVVCVNLIQPTAHISSATSSHLPDAPDGVGQTVDFIGIIVERL